MTDTITQACPICTTVWTVRELLPCPECGYTFPSRPAEIRVNADGSEYTPLAPASEARDAEALRLLNAAEIILRGYGRTALADEIVAWITGKSQSCDDPESEEMRLLTALVSVKPGCASFDKLMREATQFVAREKLPSDCWHCGGHPAGLGDGKPCPTCGPPHSADCDKTLLPGNPRAICTCGSDAARRPVQPTATQATEIARVAENMRRIAAGEPVVRSAYYRDDLRWNDGKVIHACEGERAVAFDAGTFMVWTRCQRDVPANASYSGGEQPNCPACAQRLADTTPVRHTENDHG